MRQKIELASDMGESFGNYVLGKPEEVMKLINTAFVACGFHAGDPSVMLQTVKWCKQYHVILGAHPGYPDLLGFGRRYMKVTPEEARNYTIYQVGALKNFAEHVGVKIRTAKPHGAFYKWCIESEENAKAVLEGLMTIGTSLEALHLPALPDTPFHQAVKKAGLRLIGEFYPGLAYTSTGDITVSRTYVADPVSETQMVMKYVKTGKVETIEGKDIDLNAETITVHGDMANCPEILVAMREALGKEGVEIAPAL